MADTALKLSGKVEITGQNTESNGEDKILRTGQECTAETADPSVGLWSPAESGVTLGQHLSHTLLLLW